VTPPQPDLTCVTWRTSTYSQGGTECVEVSDDLPGAVPVRDSKNPTGPVIVMPAGAWSEFIHGVKTGPLA
jgi:Domain of unknown function (DUF397)